MLCCKWWVGIIYNILWALEHYSISWLKPDLMQKALTYPSVWSSFVFLQALNDVMQRPAHVCECVCGWGGYWIISYKTLFLFCFLSLSASMSWNWANKCLSAPAASLVQLITIDRRPLGRDLLFSALTGRCLRLLTALGGYSVSHRGCLCLLRNAWDT